MPSLATLSCWLGAGRGGPVRLDSKDVSTGSSRAASVAKLQQAWQHSSSASWEGESSDDRAAACVSRKVGGRFGRSLSTYAGRAGKVCHTF